MVSNYVPIRALISYVLNNDLLGVVNYGGRDRDHLPARASNASLRCGIVGPPLHPEGDGSLCTGVVLP